MDTLRVHFGLVAVLGLLAPDTGRTHRFHGDFHHRGKRHYRLCSSLQEVYKE